jgi:PD-(D/E)XK nuclease superfamily
MFTHNIIELPKLVRIDIGKRHYVTPDGNKYPSVTTVLDATSDKTYLERWRTRVGAAEANKITTRSASRGTGAHKLCEDYVLNMTVDRPEIMPLDMDLFNQIKPILKDNVDGIMASEGSLYSDRLKVAGSVDLVARYNSEPTVIDFKTSSKPKRLEWIKNYLLQTTLYSYMFWERTGVLCKDIVIIIALEEESFAQVFTAKTSDYIDEAKAVCKRYHSMMKDVD